MFATVLAEFAIGESEQSLSTILDSIEKIIEFAESQGINLSGGHLFSLLRTLVNAYYGGQDIDFQDCALSLPGRLLFRFSRQEVYCAWPETALLAKCEDRACHGAVAEKKRNFD